MKKILVTGGAGFIGSCLAEKLAEDKNNFIVAVDNFVTGDELKIPVSVNNNILFLQADVNNLEEISVPFGEHDFEYVFHYAALVGVKRTTDNPILVLNDIEGIKNILSLSKTGGVKKVYYSSSSEVYGEPVEFPQNEHTTPLNSRLPYAIVKNVGEAYLRSFQKEHGLDYTIFRFFNTYGPKQSKDFVISRFISLALQHKPISIYGDGSQTRTFCFIDDNISATVNAFYKDRFVNDVINVGGEIEVSVLELANLVIKLSHSKSVIEHLSPLAEGDMTRRKPDITKMKTLLDRPLLPLEEGLKKILADPRYIVSLYF